MSIIKKKTLQIIALPLMFLLLFPIHPSYAAEQSKEDICVSTNNAGEKIYTTTLTDEEIEQELNNQIQKEVNAIILEAEKEELKW